MSTKDKLKALILCFILAAVMYGVLLLYFAQIIYWIRHNDTELAWVSVII